MIKIKLIRHSERLDFSHPFYWMICLGHYWSDTPLTTNGYNMAKVKGQHLATDTTFNPLYIYTSPYTRTLATGTEIQESFPHSKVIIEPLLAEYQPYYKHRINLYQAGIPTTYNGQGTDFSYPESYDNFAKRIRFILDKLVEKHDEDFIVVTHGEVLKTYTEYIQGLYPDLMLDLGSTPYLTVLSFNYDKSSAKIDEKSVCIE